MKHKHDKLLVFILYASEDKPSARYIASVLEQKGFEPWLDEEQLLPGHDWKLEIERAVDKADAIVVCLSKISINKRGFVQREIKKSLDIADEQPEGSIFLIPARIEQCQVPQRLQGTQWVDLFDPNGIEKLIEALNSRAEEIGVPVGKIVIAHELDGEYLAIGNNPEGSTYSGKAIIAQRGDSYIVIWHIGGDRFEAKGSKRGNRFTVQGDFNFQYEIKEDGTLHGEWENGASEKLTRIEKTIV